MGKHFTNPGHNRFHVGAASFARLTVVRSHQIFKFRPDTKTELSCLLYLPKDYAKSPEKKWPFILYLHGAGERGENQNKNLAVGLPSRLEFDKDFPFVVICPLCPNKQWWTAMLPNLRKLVETITASYNIDKTRIYGTGLSMGGYGIWGMSIAVRKKLKSSKILVS